GPRARPRPGGPAQRGAGGRAAGRRPPRGAPPGERTPGATTGAKAAPTEPAPPPAARPRCPRLRSAEARRCGPLALVSTKPSAQLSSGVLGPRLRPGYARGRETRKPRVTRSPILTT